jgi:urease accessory protein UreE
MPLAYELGSVNVMNTAHLIGNRHAKKTIRVAQKEELH